MTRPPRDIAASVRQRLLNLSRERREEFQSVLTRFAIERFMFRLAQSPHADEFVLKGAMLFTCWTGEAHRATWDLDLLGCGEIDVPRMETVFRVVCTTQVPDDGLLFDGASVQGERIREEQEYEGVRIKLGGRLGVARVSIQVDIGFGDAVSPSPRSVAFPTLLDFPAPHLKAYPRETAIAEKFQAMVVLGIANSRMKDFYDVWSLAEGFPFDGAALAKAIQATLERRRTPLPAEEPLALSATFAVDPVKATQWKAFVRKGRLHADPPDLAAVIAVLRAFLWPPTERLARRVAFAGVWPAGGPWRTTPSSQPT